MEIEELCDRIIRQTIERGGATFDVKNGELLEPKDAWYYPRYPGLTKITPQTDFSIALKDFITEHRSKLVKKGNYLGTWINPETDDCYLDITTFNPDPDWAVNHARQLSYEQGRQILALYNPYQDKSIEV